MCLLTNIFNLYNETIPRGLDDLPGFINGGSSRNKCAIRMTVLITDSEKNELLDKVVKKSKKKALIIIVLRLTAWC